MPFIGVDGQVRICLISVNQEREARLLWVAIGLFSCVSSLLFREDRATYTVRVAPVDNDRGGGREFSRRRHVSCERVQKVEAVIVGHSFGHPRMN